MQGARALLLDRPLPALDAALFWSQRTLRAPNYRVTFKRKGMELFWHEFLYAEFIVAIASFLLLLK